MKLETPRLLIRSFHRDDAIAYHAIVSDADVMQHLGGVLSADQSVQYIERALRTEATTGFSRYAVELKETGEMVGMCGFAPVKDYIDLGYRFAKDKWGLGLATEAALAVVDFGFTELGFTEIVGLTHPDNHASINVLKKLGFQYVREEVTPMGMTAKRFVVASAQD